MAERRPSRHQAYSPVQWSNPPSHYPTATNAQPSTSVHQLSAHTSPPGHHLHSGSYRTIVEAQPGVHYTEDYYSSMPPIYPSGGSPPTDAHYPSMGHIPPTHDAHPSSRHHIHSSNPTSSSHSHPHSHSHSYSQQTPAFSQVPANPHSPSHSHSHSRSRSQTHYPYAQPQPVSGMGHHPPPQPHYAVQAPASQSINISTQYPATPMRPFSCDLCALSFNRQHDLKRHRETHTGEKPFLCNGGCGKTFTRKDALKRHQLVKGCGKVDEAWP